MDAKRVAFSPVILIVRVLAAEVSPIGFIMMSYVPAALIVIVRVYSYRISGSSAEDVSEENPAAQEVSVAEGEVTCKVLQLDPTVHSTILPELKRVLPKSNSAPEDSLLSTIPLTLYLISVENTSVR